VDRDKESLWRALILTVVRQPCRNRMRRPQGVTGAIGPCRAKVPHERSDPILPTMEIQ
jgi:hypothetical protein